MSPLVRAAQALLALVLLTGGPGARASTVKADELAFEMAIRDMLSSRGLTLKNALYSNEMRRELFGLIAVQRYLGRLADAVTWTNDHPVLDPNGLEARIYEILRDVIPYRANHADPSFYAHGTETSTLPFFAELTRRRGANVFVAEPLDTYDIRNFVNKLVHDEVYLNHSDASDDAQVSRARRYTFHLYPMAKDAHAALIAVVFDVDRQRPLAGLLINSNAEPGQHAYYETRWSLPDRYRYMLRNPKVAEAMDVPKLSAPSQSAWTPGPAINYVETDAKGRSCLVMNRPVPLVDASLHLQVDDTDQNCVLYALDFRAAVGRMLDEHAACALALAGRVELDPEASQALVELFREGLKAHLPQYFDADRGPRSAADIKRHHLAQRWSVSGEFIKELGKPNGFFSSADRSPH